MSDKKPPLDFGLEDLDWDAAIAEWEQTTLVPEVAKDKEAAAKAYPAPRPAAGTPATGVKPPPHPPSAPAPKGAPPVNPRGGAGLGQLFKGGRTSEPHRAPPVAAPPPQDDREVGETTRQTTAPPPAEAPEPRESEDVLSATLADASGNAAIDALLGTTSERDALANLGPGDDEPTHYIRRKAPAPRPAPVHVIEIEHEADRDDATLARRPAHAHAPSQRPPSDLATTTEAGIAGPESARTRTFVRKEEDEPTRQRLRSEFPSLRAGPPEEPHEDVPPPRVFEDEAAAKDALDDGAKEGLLERARWFEDEARAIHDAALGARTLLTASELYAMSGQIDDATRVAMEAREIEPRLPLAHWQARALLPRGMDVPAVVTALEAESRHAITPAHRLHAMLMAAEHLRVAGQDEEASNRWDHAAHLAPDDARAVTSRAGRALARQDYANPGLRFGQSVPLASISLATGTVLRLRGAERADGDAGEILANDSLRRARAALEHGDLPTASTLLAELRSVPELAKGATWLAAVLGATRSETRSHAGLLLRRIIDDDDGLARRMLAAVGVEIGDSALVDAAMSDDETFAPHERATLAALMRMPLPQTDAELEDIASSDGMAPLAAAVAAIAIPTTLPETRARAKHTAGTEVSRKIVTLGRLLATDAPEDDVEAALRETQGEDATRAIALELAARAGRFDEVSAKLASWQSGSSSGASAGAAARDQKLAAALVAERAGQRERAVEAYRQARAADPSREPAVRAILDLDPRADIAMFLDNLADATHDPLEGALLRLEGVARATELEDVDILGQLEHVHKAAPALPFASFLAERIARRNGNVDEVLRWIRERRTQATDPLEGALDAVREALLVADAEPDTAAERLAEAHQARPEDVALRELFERLAVDPPSDRGTWRETRAQSAIGPSQALLFIEAAHEFERAGDKDGFLRAAQSAKTAGDDGLARLALERAEVEGGSAARLADELLALARSADDPRERREAYERLADLDAVGRGDPASALLWHRAILEVEPTHRPSLRYVEHAYLSGGRDEEIEPIASAIAKMLAGTGGGECAAHAELASRLRLRGEAGWEGTRELAEVAATQTEAPLWALRLVNAHARAQKDDAQILMTTLALVPKTNRPAELAALHLRAGEAAARQDNADLARGLLERAAKEDPGDVVTWGLLAEVRQRSHDARGAAEAGESLARTSAVPRHQLLAWYDSARLWLDEVKEEERAVACLEQVAKIDLTYEDAFSRLSALYAKRGAREELAALLEKRIASVSSPEEKVELEVERGRALAEIGEEEAARKALKAALTEQPDHVEALAAYGDLCASAGDWDEAEQTWVRLARSLSDAEEQREVYKKLGDLYAVHAINLSRAEVAFKEVLKRAPSDAPTLERLVNVYARQKDAPRAIEAQQQLLGLAKDPAERKTRIVQLATLYDEVAHDARKAEQTLETARRESPADVSILRGLAEFYTRHKQMPAVNILLDRASGDARRALAAGRFAPGSFEVLQAVYELRGRKDAARVVGATLAAFEGRGSNIRGGETRSADPRLDELLAPELLTPALRALLVRTGDALDAASPLDLRALKATQLPQSAATLHRTIGELGHQMGVGPVQALVSSQLARTCVPCASSPPMIVLGESLLSAPSDAARTFLVMRALKLVQARASALVRTPAADMAILMAAWLHVFNPQWRPEGFSAQAVAEAARRLQSGLPRQLAPDVGVIALEVAGSVGTQGATLGTAAISWANRMSLLAVGDPNAAFEAIAWSLGSKEGPPAEQKERAAWATRTLEIRDLLAFSVSDAYAEARTRLGLDKA